MSIKNELILSYIKALEPGSKISVRKLAERLDVSEGTVYKAIKLAEAQGLVVTKPKAGTFRVDTGFTQSAEPMSLKRMAKLLGLTTLVEPQDFDRVINRIVICDGDEKQLRAALSPAAEENRGVLCLTGRRQDMQALAVELGANLLLTGGAPAAAMTLVNAERAGLSVLSCSQDTYMILRLMDEHAANFECSADTVKSWMKTPNYIFSNDVVADWHRLYESAYPAVSPYPVVDEKLHLCGELDVARAFASNPSQRISGILSPGTHQLQFDEDAGIYSAAEEMLLSGRSLAAVTHGGKMSGTVDASDMLRCFLYSRSPLTASGFGAFLEEAELPGEDGGRYYRMRLPRCGDDPAALALPIVLSAAHRHAKALLGEGCTLESGTFFSSKPVEYSDGLMLSSRAAKQDGRSCTLEEEIFDESSSYVKAVVMFSCRQGDSHGHIE